MPSLSVFNVGQTSISWRINDLSSFWDDDFYQYAYITISGEGSSNPIYPPTNGTSYDTQSGSFSGLTAGTNYTATAYVVVPAGGTYSAGSTSFTTASPPQPPSDLTGLVSTGRTFTSVSLSWNSASGASGYYIYLDNVYQYSTSSTSTTVGGLNEGTEYRFSVTPYNDYGTGNGQSIWVTTLTSRPSNFNWQYAGINPATGQVVAGDSKISGYGFYLAADEFTSLQSKINQFRQFKNLSQYSFTPVSSGGLFYYWLFNQCVTAINECSPNISPPSNVASGQNISAAMLNQLKNSLNSIQ